MPEEIEMRDRRDLRDNEANEDLDDARDDVDEISNGQDEESVELRGLARRASAAANAIDHSVSEQENVSIVVERDASYFSDIENGDRPLQRDAQDVHGEIGGAPARGRLVTRWKFWSAILPSAINLVITLPFSILAAVWAYRKGQASEAKPNADLPPEVKALLKEKAEEWSNKPISEAFPKISELVKTYSLSLQAQAFILGDLKILAQQPPDKPQQWGEGEQKRLVDALLSAYTTQNTTPQTLALYNTVPTLYTDTPQRPLTVHEGADVCDLALCQIITLSKAREN